MMNAKIARGSIRRCVYRCENDVVDRQVVNLEFAAFTMCAFTRDFGRSIKLMGTKGEIAFAAEKSRTEGVVVELAAFMKELHAGEEKIG